MKNFFKTIYVLLSNKRASLFIIIFCIISKSLLISFYTYTGKDKIYSLSASHNLLYGKGWTNSFYYTNNLNTEVLIPFCYWPPGYGLLISPVQMLFGNDIYASTAVFEIICFIIFILLCRAILKTQKISAAWLNISTLILSFFSHDFIENSLGTDLLALNFVLGFFYNSIRVWNEDEKKLSLLFGAIAGICLFGAGFTRYIYTPVCMFIAVVVLLISLWKKNKMASRGYLLSLFICFCGLIAAMLFQQATCGSPFYTGIDNTGIFWENLRYWHPAAIASFLNLNLAPVQLEKYSPVSYSSWLTFFSWLNLVICFLLLIVFCIYFRRKKKEEKNNFYFFVFTGFLLTAAIIGGLALLSLTHQAKYTLSGTPWTFIVEGRYHAFPVVFLQLLFLIVVAKRNDLFSFRKFSSACYSLLFILLLLNSVHQLYYTAKVALNYHSMKAASVREQDYVYFENWLIKTIKETPAKDILVASSDKYYPLLASMHGQKGLADPYKLNEYIPAVSKPAVLITVIFVTEEKLYSDYINKKEVKLMKEISGTKFYMQLLNPQQEK
jgi:hypothetical protein